MENHLFYRPARAGSGAFKGPEKENQKSKGKNQKSKITLCRTTGDVTDRFPAIMLTI